MESKPKHTGERFQHLSPSGPRNSKPFARWQETLHSYAGWRWRIRLFCPVEFLPPQECKTTMEVDLGPFWARSECFVSRGWLPQRDDKIILFFAGAQRPVRVVQKFPTQAKLRACLLDGSLPTDNVSDVFDQSNNQAYMEQKLKADLPLVKASAVDFHHGLVGVGHETLLDNTDERGLPLCDWRPDGLQDRRKSARSCYWHGVNVR